MAFELKPLPFPKESLGPTMSASTLEHHHDKHHATYVKKLNELIAGTQYAGSDLEVDHQGDGAQGQGKGQEDLQQRSAGLESRLLLGVARAERRRPAAGSGPEAHQRQLRLGGHLP